MILGILVGLMLLIGICFIIFMWPPSTVPIIEETYKWTIGNDVDTQTITSLALWPYSKINSQQIALTILGQLAGTIPAHSSAPLTVTLPTRAKNLSSLLTFSNISLPVSDTDVKVVQYGPSSVAFQFEPSGTYLPSSALTYGYTVLFSVSYQIP